MLRKVEPVDILLALKSLLVNTPHALRTESTPKTITTADDLTAYLNDFGSRAEWVKCPSCETRLKLEALREGKIYDGYQPEWNNLTEEGICIACQDEKAASEKREREGYEYLLKTIGKYGIERYTFAAFDVNDGNRDAFEAAREFDWMRDNLFIFGDCGVGKTHLAGAILKQVIGAGTLAKWVSPMYISRLIKSKWPSEEEAVIDWLAFHPVLIIDDLGASRDADVAWRTIYEICDKRKARKMNGLVITSNVALDEVAKHLKDDRIASRIDGLCRSYHIEGDDRRDWRTGQ